MHGIKLIAMGNGDERFPVENGQQYFLINAALFDKDGRLKTER